MCPPPTTSIYISVSWCVRGVFAVLWWRFGSLMVLVKLSWGVWMQYMSCLWCFDDISVVFTWCFGHVMMLCWWLLVPGPVSFLNSEFLPKLISYGGLGSYHLRRWCLVLLQGESIVCRLWAMSRWCFHRISLASWCHVSKIMLQCTTDVWSLLGFGCLAASTLSRPTAGHHSRKLTKLVEQPQQGKHEQNELKNCLLQFSKTQPWLLHLRF